MHVEVALIAVVIVSVLGFGIVICMYWRATRKHNKALAILYDQLMKVTRVPPTTLGRSLDQNVANLAYKKKYEVKREMLSIGNKIGEGQFGQVWVGVLKRSRGRRPSRKELMEKLPVAIKGPLDGKDPLHHKTLADELKILCAIGKHPNVLGLVGAITKNMLKGEFFVITEFCEYGNLKKFLEDRKSNFINELDGLNSFMQGCYANELDQQWSEDLEHSRLLPGSPSLTTSDLLSFGMQVAQGMEYLSSRPCIHRDLAARNVLITSNFVCRVADFGLAKHEDRDYYRAKTDVPMPVRWMSIEAIDQGLFTVESDVWSYGILLYELFTLGDRPYPTISDVESLSLGHRLKKGLRNSRPIYCHEEIYQLMQQCWQEQTGKRPTFTQCANLMKRHLERSSPQLLRSVQNNISEEAASQEHYENLISQDMPYIMYTQGAGCIFSAKSCLVMWTVVAIIPSLFLFPMGLSNYLTLL